MGELARLLSIMVLSLTGPGTLEVPGIERVLRAHERLLVGSQPPPEALAALAALGVSVVVSVDGMPPQVDRLEAAGLRSIHLPIGYDTVPQERVRSLARLAQEEEGVIYVHCHHGRHRAPAVAAIFWMLRSGVSSDQARVILEAAGTSTDYAGLWRAVESFQMPEGDFSDAPLPRRVAVDGLAACMVEIDRARSHLARHDREQPHVAPRHEARILSEHLRELDRLDPEGRSKRDPDWRARLGEARAAAEALSLVPDSDKSAWTDALGRLDSACASCHAAHRD